MYANEDGTCWSIRCDQPATHTLTTKATFFEPLFEQIAETRYCLNCALYFAAWLPYCYPGEQELVSITPPASELFRK